jgi:periplasmic copper chaperone A
MKHVIHIAGFAALLGAWTISAPVAAQITIKEPWVRATVAAQKATGAFMQISSASDAKLIEAKSPVAGTVEIHEMKMDNNVMKMRAVPDVALPAGKMVELKPGGYHVMMMDLKAQVKEGDTVPLTLVFEGKDKKRETVEVKAVAKSLTGAAAKGEMSHEGHKH